MYVCCQMSHMSQIRSPTDASTSSTGSSTALQLLEPILKRSSTSEFGTSLWQLKTCWLLDKWTSKKAAWFIQDNHFNMYSTEDIHAYSRVTQPWGKKIPQFKLYHNSKKPLDVKTNTFRDPDVEAETGLYEWNGGWENLNKKKIWLSLQHTGVVDNNKVVPQHFLPLMPQHRLPLQDGKYERQQAKVSQRNDKSVSQYRHIVRSLIFS